MAGDVINELYTNLLTSAPPQLHPFLSLQYPNPSRLSTIKSKISSSSSTAPTLYGKGPLDLCIPFTCAVGFTLARILVMDILAILSRRWLTPTLRKGESLSRREKRKVDHAVIRFAEQGWSLLYCTVFWSLGVYILSRLDSPLSPESLWGSYPVMHLPGLTKFYYLAQLGWWFHQLYVINTEKRRSDHYQMLTHHFLSIGLICGSYIAHFTRVGTVIHALMDFCDILLPLAKLLRYLSFFTLCDITFGLFFFGWFTSRQMGLAYVIYTSYYDAPRFIPFKWDPSNGLFLTKGTYWGFIGMQVFLYCLATAWFYMALVVAIKVVRGEGADDTRSDDEGESEDMNGNGHVLERIEEVPDAHTSSMNGSPINGDMKKRK